jgi:hypothetical protein
MVYLRHIVQLIIQIYRDYVQMFRINTTVTCHPKCISYQPTKCMQRQNTSKDEITNCYSVSQSKWHLHVDAWFAALLVQCRELSCSGHLLQCCHLLIPRQHEMIQSPACRYNKMILDA